MGNGKEEVLPIEQCLEKMLYSDGVSASAIGKLYKTEIFNTIRFPVGKISEDVGTTYKFLLQASKIACGYKDKYNYCIRKNSITTSPFDIKNLDLLEMTDDMIKDICLAFPRLHNAAIRYQVWARFSVLNRMLNVTSKYVGIRRQIIKFILSNGENVKKNPKAQWRDKIAILLLQLGLPIYKFSWAVYLWIAK